MTDPKQDWADEAIERAIKASCEAMGFDDYSQHLQHFAAQALRDEREASYRRGWRDAVDHCEEYGWDSADMKHGDSEVER